MKLSIRTSRITIAGVAALSLMVNVLHLSPAQASEIKVKIAFQGPLSGPEAEIGLGQLQALKYMVTKFNLQTKGIFKVEVVEVDDQGDPLIAATLAPKIADDQSIVALVGPSYSGATKASLPFYKAKSLPLISPSATNPTLTDPTSSYFGAPVFHRVVQGDKEQAIALARVAQEGITNSKTYLVTDDQLWPGFKDKFLASGISLVGNQEVLAASENYAQLVADVLSKKATAVVLTGYLPTTVKIITQLREGGYKNRIVLSDASYASDYAAQLFGKYAEGLIFTTSMASPKALPAELQFDYKNTVGNSVPLYAVPALEASRVFLNCIAKGNTSRKAILDCVGKYSGKTLLGEEISFDVYGDMVGPSFPTVIIKNGNFVVLTSSDLVSSDASSQLQIPSVLSFSFVKKKLEISIDISQGAVPDSTYIIFPTISSKKIFATLKNKTAQISIPLTAAMYGKTLAFQIFSARKGVESKPYAGTIEIPNENSVINTSVSKAPKSPTNLSYTASEKGHGITVEIDTLAISKAANTYLYSQDLGISKKSAVKGLMIGNRAIFKVAISPSLVGKKVSISLYSENSIGVSPVYLTTIQPKPLESSTGNETVACQKASQIRTFEAKSCPPGWFKR